jgi:tetratricopeptide (TPR) repeat protein
MKLLRLSASLLCFASASFCLAEPVHCAVQKPAVQTEGDTALASGDAARSETLFAAQVGMASTVSNFLGLVRAQLDQDKLPDALANAQKATAAFPASAEAEALLGSVMTRSGQIPDALLAFKKALALDICSVGAHFGLAKLDLLNVAYASASQQLSVAHKLAPDDAEITAAFIELQPEDNRLPLIQSLLTSQAVLSPAMRQNLTTKAAILEQHLSCKPVESYGVGQLELQPVLYNGKSARSWGLKANLNNASSPLLELDTSVSGIVLSVSDAKKAGVKALSGATDAPYTGYVDAVRFGKMSYRNCPVRVVPDTFVAGSNSLIGADFFRDRLIHIDYAGTTLTLSPLPSRPGVAADALSDRYVAPEQSNWSRAFVSGPAVLLPTMINDKGPVLFMVDTGIVRSVISPQVSHAQLISTKDATLPLRGSVGPIVKILYKEGGGDFDRTDVRFTNGQLVKVSTPLKLPVFHFTNNTYPDSYSISFDLSPLSRQAGTEVSGLLGFSILRSYALDLDYRDGLVQVVFDQNRRYERQHSEGYY